MWYFLKYLLPYLNKKSEHGILYGRELGYFGAATGGNVFENFYAQSFSQPYLNPSVAIRILLFQFSIINLLFSLIDSSPVCYVDILQLFYWQKNFPLK